MRNGKSLSYDSEIFRYNEKQANHYTAICLLITAGITAVMWCLNTLGFFIVDKTLMNIVMPSGMVMLIIPYILERSGKVRSGVLKYIIICSFLVGIGIMSSVLTLQLVAAWACPLIMSCHYYSPKLTRFTFFISLVVMLAAFYIGLFIGVWDANIMRSSVVANTIAERLQHVGAQALSGDNVYLRAFNFYYLPRAIILLVVYLIGNTLSRRTHGLLKKQDEITRETERISAELTVAMQIQTSMLPNIFPAFPERTEFEINATMKPAKEVGGDFYDFFMVDKTHLAVVIADVSGKGVPAALFMVIGKTLIKEHTTPGRDLGELLTAVNRLLCDSNSEGFFITVFEGVLDLVSGELEFVNAGHEPLFICRGDGSYEMEKVSTGFVLAGMDDTVYRSEKLTLSPGDKLFIYTDGVPEASDAGNDMYGIDRLKEILNQNRDKAPAEILPEVQRDIDRFIAGAPQFDDITMLCLEYRSRMSDR